MNFAELKKSLKNLILQLFPELAGTHLPIKARVLAVHGDPGTVEISSGPRRYSVDVQPLRPDGEIDPTRDILLDVPLDVLWAGPNRGIFCLPAVGSIVRIAFWDGNASYPYVDGTTPEGFTVPAVAIGELIIQHSPGRALKWDADGHLTIELFDGADLNITVHGDLSAHANGNVNLTAGSAVNLGDLGGQPVARVGDAVAVSGYDSRGDFVEISGSITSGSTKVRAS